MIDSSVRAVVFDAEGVVIDTSPIWDWSQEEFLGRRGIAYDRASVKPLLSGRSIEEGTQVLIDRFGLDGTLDALVSERREIVRDAIATRTKFITGADGFVRTCAARGAIALATAMDPGLFDIADEKLHLSTLFAGFVTTLRDVRRGKPAPDLFLSAARSIGVTPSDCVVIEDAPLGVDAAHAAGMRCIGIATTYDKSKLEHADVVVANFEQMRRLIAY